MTPTPDRPSVLAQRAAGPAAQAPNPSPAAEPVGPGAKVAGSAPKPPKGAGSAGRALWRSIVAEYELEQHELALLEACVRTVDVLAALEARVAADGPLLASSQGDRAHPALVEARQQRITLARLFAALRLPAGDEAEGAERRPQRRSGVRGVYGIGGMA